MDDLNAPQFIDFDNSSFLQISDDSFFAVERAEHERRRSEKNDFDECKDDSKTNKIFSKSLGMPKPKALSTPLKSDIVESSGKENKMRFSATPKYLGQKKIVVDEEKSILKDDRKSLRKKNSVNDENVISKETEKNGKKLLKPKNSIDENLITKETEKKINVSKTLKEQNVAKENENLIIKKAEKKIGEKEQNVVKNNENLIIKKTEKKIDVAKTLKEKNVDNGNLIRKETEMKIDVGEILNEKNVALDNENCIIKETEKINDEKLMKQKNVSVTNENKITKETDEKKDLREKDSVENIVETKTEAKNSKNLVGVQGAKGKIAISSKQNIKSAKENITIQSTASTKARVLASIKSRRQSISKARRRNSTKFVSLAESVSAYQNAIPQRFRSTNSKDYQAGPLKRTKQTTMKLTTPQSPALLCKFRARVASATKEERQKLQKINEPRKTTVNQNLPKKENSSSVRAPNLRRSISVPSINFSTKNQSQHLNSVKEKDNQSGPLKKTKITTMKLTKPQSPALLCKFRARVASASNEQKKINESQKTFVSSNSTKKNDSTKFVRSLSVPSMAKKSEKIETKIIKKPKIIIKDPPKIMKNSVKSVKNPPKNMNGPLKALENPAKITANSTVKNLPKTLKNPSRILLNQQKKDSKIANLMNAPKNLTVPKTPMKLENLSKTLDKTRTPGKTLVHSVVSTKDEGLIVEQVEICHFGIPIDKRYQDKKITRPIPFSFEARSKSFKKTTDEPKNQKEMRKTICSSVKSSTGKSVERFSK